MDEVVKIGQTISADLTYTLNNGKHYVAVTFDDGFQSVINNALPVMRERKIPATIFITTGFLGKKPGWILNPNHENANEVLLTEEQVKQLPDDLIIGSHTVSHPYLTKIDMNRAIKELIDSKKTLEDILHTHIDLFSLPYGDYNNNIIELSKKAGYKRIYLNIPTFPFTKIGENIIGRIDLTLDDWLIEYRLKMLGAYQWLPLAIRIKHKTLILIKGFLRSIKKYSYNGNNYGL